MSGGIVGVIDDWLRRLVCAVRGHRFVEVRQPWGVWVRVCRTCGLPLPGFRQEAT